MASWKLWIGVILFVEAVLIGHYITTHGDIEAGFIYLTVTVVAVTALIAVALSRRPRR